MPEMIQAPLDSAVVYVKHMEREREEGQNRCHYLNISPLACLDRQDLHVEFSARALGEGGVKRGGCSGCGSSGKRTSLNRGLSAYVYI